MWKLLKQLQRDDYGVILSTEIVVVGSVLVIGLMTGLTCLQQAVNGELTDMASAFSHLDQSYSYTGHVSRCNVRGCGACTAGASFHDCDDRCEDDCEKVTHGLTAIACTTPCATGCGTVGCGTTNCGGCGSYSGGCFSGCRTGGYSFYGPVIGTGSRCVSTGVPNMRVTEWPLAPVPAVPCADCGPQTSGVIDGNCSTCNTTQSSGSFINIPDSVW